MKLLIIDNFTSLALNRRLTNLVLQFGYLQSLTRVRMAKYNKLWILFSLGIGGVAIIFLSAGLSRLELLPGHAFPLGRILQAIINSPGTPFAAMPLPGILWSVLIILFWILLLIWIITFILRPEARKYLLRRMMTYLIWFLFIYILMNALQSLPPWGERLIPPEAALPEPSTLLEDFLRPPAFIANPPQWLVFAISVSLIALLLGLIWFFWQRLPRLAEGPLERLAQEAHQALEELRTGSDLKDTIMRCYREMSRVLSEQQGIQRPNSMTPREFEQVLSKSGLRDEHIQQLTRLFEGVRYGAKAPGEREEREAIACLTAIVQAYGKSA